MTPTIRITNRKSLPPAAQKILLTIRWRWIEMTMIHRTKKVPTVHLNAVKAALRDDPKECVEMLLNEFFFLFCFVFGNERKRAYY